MEDKEKLSEGEQLYNLTQSKEWALFKDRYEDVTLRLADIRNIPFELEDANGNKMPVSPEQRTYEMQVRERTLMYLQEIMNGLVGDVEEYKELIKGMTEEHKDRGFIIKFDD